MPRLTTKSSSFFFRMDLFPVRSIKARKSPVTNLSHHAIFFVAIILMTKPLFRIFVVILTQLQHGYGEKMGKNFPLNPFSDVLSIWCRKQCFNLRNAVICTIRHLSVALYVIDLGRIICIKRFSLAGIQERLNKIKTDRTLSVKQNVLPKQVDHEVRDTRDG